MALTLSQAADPAPALTRGLELLRRLGQDGPTSLERLAARTGYPKSSVNRFLQSLVAAGAVGREPVSRRYYARMRLAPVDGEGLPSIREAAEPVLAKLAEEAGHTAELHAFADDPPRLVMIERWDPEDAVVSAKARVGSQRTLHELDAMAQVVLAFGRFGGDPPAGPFWAWDDGRQRPIPRGEVPGVTEHVRREGVGVDLGVNSNAVRRYAAPIREPAGKLRAVLALAQVCPPTARRPDPHLTALTRAAADQINRSFTNHLSSPPKP